MEQVTAIEVSNLQSMAQVTSVLGRATEDPDQITSETQVQNYRVSSPPLHVSSVALTTSSYGLRTYNCLLYLGECALENRVTISSLSRMYVCMYVCMYVRLSILPFVLLLLSFLTFLRRFCPFQYDHFSSRLSCFLSHWYLGTLSRY